MRSSISRIAGAIGLALLVAGLAPAWADPAPEVSSPIQNCQSSAILFTPANTGPIKPVFGSGCLGSQVMTCDDMVMPVGSSCSCQTTLLQKKCVNCDTRKEGLTLQTTCTVCPPCFGGNCHLRPCYDRSSLTCPTS